MRRVLDPLTVEADWPSALARACSDPGSVTPVFQPIVDLRHGRVSGYEGLSRFAGPLRAGPAEWFAAAALYGYSSQLEAAVLRAFLEARADLPEDCFLSVNASPEGIVSDEVGAVLEAEGDLRGLVLEVTEQTPVEDYGRLTSALRRWRADGALVAVDDAGSGYASLRHILALEPDFVKIDRSLVTGLHSDPRKAAVVEAIGAFAGALDAWIIAEGVEEAAELDALVGMRVPLVQGWHLGRPGPEMAQLDQEVADRIRLRGAQRDAGGIGWLVEPAPQGVDVVLDEHRRPVTLRIDGFVHPVLAAEPDTELRDLALRAMARPEEHRFTPVACCDGRGRYLGVVRIERLVEALSGLGA